MMKTTKRLLCCALAASTLISTSVFAASWQDSLSSAASELSKQSSGSQGGSSLSSLTSLLNGSNQSLTSSSMNNAAGILEYCAKQKLASVTDTQNVKNQVLENWASVLRSRNKTPTIWTAFRGCSTPKMVNNWT